MANLRTQQFQLIDKLNDTEVELAESRHMLSNLQNEVLNFICILAKD